MPVPQVGFEPTMAQPLHPKCSPYTSSGTEANINDTTDFNLFKQEPLGRIELPSHDWAIWNFRCFGKNNTLFYQI